MRKGGLQRKRWHRDGPLTAVPSSEIKFDKLLAALVENADSGVAVPKPDLRLFAGSELNPQ